MSRTWTLWMPVALLLAVMASAVTVVVAKHENRAQVTALESVPDLAAAARTRVSRPAISSTV